MTRFMISLEESVKLVWHAFHDMQGGEIYVKKIPSMTIPDIASAVDEKSIQKVIGIRPGEKIHEQMIGLEDAAYTYEYPSHFKILPSIHNWSKDPVRIKEGIKVDENFTYSSDNNKEWMTIDELSTWIEKNRSKIGLL
jgi:FlaA1/EpsC-like NDP-sugar epimerase